MPLFTKPKRPRRVPLSKRVLAKRRAREASGNHELSEDEKDAHVLSLWGHPANREMIDPPERKRIPKEGAWIMITRQLPPLEGGLDEHIRFGRIFYAEHENGTDAAGFAPDGMYKVKVRSPWADVSLWPYEYMVLPVEEILKMWQSGELVFNPTNVEPGRLNAIVFYARSRCIGLADAMVMALGSLAAPVGWFEPSEELAGAVEAMANIGGPLTEENHRRRAAAQARKRQEEGRA